MKEHPLTSVAVETITGNCKQLRMDRPHQVSQTINNEFGQNDRQFRPASGTNSTENCVGSADRKMTNQTHQVVVDLLDYAVFLGSFAELLRLIIIY